MLPLAMVRGVKSAEDGPLGASSREGWPLPGRTASAGEMEEGVRRIEPIVGIGKDELGVIMSVSYRAGWRFLKELNRNESTRDRFQERHTEQHTSQKSFQSKVPLVTAIEC